ncbi:MATE family efflux transporter [Ruminococcus sp. CLA-AA-H200]|uniref:MATE family efflux transporter n=1 Tax=Ruminococcus turbiniformis TaxID=2881258 RepID=A0ABS8G1K3_9FIRM|nr:MATE family efflux transporter [Ruminococcus turbiniformis]MCC2256200.1 MATE family efflux transporter [Ruminococcus turbiniformis]
MNTGIDFINGNTKKCLLAMTLPMIAAMFLNMAYNLVDSLWIGNLLGEQAYAALTNSTPVILMLTSIGMGATNGVTILLSRAIGSKDNVKKNKVLSTSFFVSVIFSIFLTILLEIFLPAILAALNTPSEIFDMARSYLAIYIAGYITVYLYLYFTAVLRSLGDTIFQAIAMLVSTLLNAVLDPVFIKITGFQGAAAATLLSQCLCLLFMIAYISKKKLFAIHITDFDVKGIAPLIKNAVPSVIQQSIPAVSTTFLTALVSTYGISAIAAYGITGKLETILFYPAMALNMVLTSIVGQCIGAKRADRAGSYLKFSLKYGIITLTILSAIVIIFSEQLSGLFVSSNDAAAIVKHYFNIVSIGYVLYTVSSCFLGTLNGMGKPVRSMLLMIFYYIIVRIPLAYFLSFMHWGLNGIWVAILVSHIISCIAAALICIFSFRSLN